MSDWFWKKLNYLTGLGAIAVLFSLIVFASRIEIKDLDLWLHIGTGRYIAENHTIPQTDVLSCTVAGKPWINHEWLFQIIVYSLFERFGADGLIQLQSGVVLITFILLLFLGYRGEKQSGRIFILLLVFLIYQTRFTLRPDIFSLLFLILYIYFLTFLLHRWWAFIPVFIVQVLWTNMHGFFILGPLVAGISLLTEFLKRQLWLPRRFKGDLLSLPEYQRLKQIFGIVLLACLINPYFIKGALYPAGVLFSLSGESKIFFQYISELQRPLTLSNLFNLGSYLQYKLLIVISLLSFFIHYRKINIGLLLFWIVFLWISLMAVRNLVFFAAAAYIVFIFNTQNMSFKKILPLPLRKERGQQILAIGLNIFLMIWMGDYLGQLSLRGYFDFDKFERKSEYGGISLRSFPNKAVDFLARNDIKGNFFNDFNSGAYLVGRRSPDVKVFIDGRTEVYGAKFFEYYRRVWQGNEKLLNEVIDHYQLTGAFLHSVYSPVPRETLKYFYENQEWALVYFDYDAAIFLKDVPRNKEVINQYHIDLSRWETPDADLLKFGVKNLTPYQYINRAYVLFHLKFYDQAQVEIEEALRTVPAYTEAYQLLGKVLLEQKKYNEAFENLRKAKILDPYDMETRYCLAQVFYDLNILKDAENQCQYILSQDPQNAKARSLLSLIDGKKRNFYHE